MKKLIYSFFISLLLVSSLKTELHAQVTVTSVAVPDANVNQGTTAQIVYAANMAVTSTVTVTSVQVKLSGTHDANDLNTLRVYFNPTAPTVAGAATFWSVSAAFASPHTYNVNISRAMAGGSSGYFIIAVDVDNTATDNNTVTVNGAADPLVFGFSTSPTITNTQSNLAGNLTFQAADISVSSFAVPAADVNQGTTAQIVYAAKMDVQTMPLTVTSVQVKLSGTHDGNDLNTLRVYFNPTAPTVAGAATFWSVSAAFASSHTYNVNISRAMAAGSSGYFVIAVDIDNTATDNNTVTVNGAADPLVFGFDRGPNVTNTQSNLAGNLTIQAADISVNSFAVPAADVNQGTTAQIVYAAKMDVQTMPLTVTSVQVKLSGTHDANDLNTLRVYFNPTAPTVAGAATFWSVSAAFASPHTYNVNISRAMAAGSSGYFVIAVDIDNTATDNNTISVDGAVDPLVFGFDRGPNVTNTQSDLAGDLTIQAADITLSTIQVPQTGIVQGENIHVVEAVKMEVQTQPVVVTSIQFTLEGTHDANDLSTVRVYFNATAPTVAGAATFWSVSGAFGAPDAYNININRSMAVGSSGYFIVAVDVKPAATAGHTVVINGGITPVTFGFSTLPNIVNNQTNEGGPLPVSLLSFDAVWGKNGTEVKWGTATETNNAYFLVEHGTDGINFSTIGKVQGKGTTTTQSNYTFTHIQDLPDSITIV